MPVLGCSKTRTAEGITLTNGDRFKRSKESITAKPEQPAKFEEERTTWRSMLHQHAKHAEVEWKLMDTGSLVLILPNLKTGS